MESIFNYSVGAGASYSEVNDGFATYLPIFLEDIIDNVSQSVIDECQNNVQCIYDYAVTGDMSVAMDTLVTSDMNTDLVITLGEYTVKA